MPYEIRVITSSSDLLQKDLSGPAAEGWQLVSCWPENQRVTAILQRPADRSATAPAPAPRAIAAKPVQPSPAAKPSFPSTSPGKLPDLDAVLEACLAQPEREGTGGTTFHQGLEVGKFAAACGVKADDMLTHLHELGIQEKDDDRETKHKDRWHRDHYIRLVKFKNGTLNLSVTHAPPKARRK